MGESLHVHGAGGEAVQRQNKNATHDAADERDDQGFKYERDGDAAAGKTDGAHGGNFSGTFGDGGVHGVERADYSADAHDERDEGAQNRDEPSQDHGLARVVVGFGLDFDGEARVGGQRIFQLGERGWRGEPHRDGLKKIFGAFVDLIDDAAVGPNFGVESAAAGVENADDIPGTAAECRGLAEFEAGVSGSDIFPDDEFGEAGLEEAAFDHMNVGPNFK